MSGSLWERLGAPWGLDIGLVLTIVVFFLLSIVLATAVIRLGLMRLRPTCSVGPRQPRLGFWLGFFETALTFVFVFHNEFGALAIIFAAKEFVRKKDVEADPAYYLLGTMANLTIAVVLALIARIVSQG